MNGGSCCVNVTYYEGLEAVEKGKIDITPNVNPYVIAENL